MHAFHSGSASDTLPLSLSFSLSHFLTLSVTPLSFPKIAILIFFLCNILLSISLVRFPLSPLFHIHHEYSVSLSLSLFLSHQSSICLLELSPSNILILSSRFQTQKQFFPFSNSFSSFSPSHSNFCPERHFLHSFKVSLSQSKSFSAEIFLCMIPTEALLAQFLIFLARASVQQVQHGLGPIRRKPRSVQLPRLHSARRHPGD